MEGAALFRETIRGGRLEKFPRFVCQPRDGFSKDPIKSAIAKRSGADSGDNESTARKLYPLSGIVSPGGASWQSWTSAIPDDSNGAQKGACLGQLVGGVGRY